MRPARLAIAIVFAALLGNGSGARAGGCRPHWVGSWSAAPSDDLAAPVTHQTLRMIVAPHFGGRTVRLHISNRFGPTSATLDGVTVAPQGDGAALAGRPRTVKFGGRRSVTMAPGADVVSDPVRLRVRPFEKLAISVYVAGTVASPTEHFITRQTSYRTPAGSGDHAGDRAGAAFTETLGGGISTGWYFISGLDVRAPGRVGAVVAFGDSITDGFEGSPGGDPEGHDSVDADARYPDALARRLLAASKPIAVLNAGISGNRILQDADTIRLFGPSGVSRLTQDALDLPGVTGVLVLEGINDIGQTPATAPQVIDGLTTLVNAIHARGLRALLGTLTPAGGDADPSYGGVAANDARVAVDEWIRMQTIADGVVDFDAAVRDPADPSRLAPAYDSGDHLHPSAAGYAAMAAAVDLDLLGAGDCRAR